MKRHKHLWERLCSFENLAAAAREALLGKRGKHAGARFFADWEREVVRLERELREGSYRPGPYFYFTITEPKERVVAAAPFRDRGSPDGRPPYSPPPPRWCITRWCA
jgi:hypothetical protein